MVVTDIVDDPEPPVTGFGLKLAFAPGGNPLALKVTLPVNPPDPVTVTPYEVSLPAVTVCEVGVGAAMEKSATTVAFTVNEMVVVWLSKPEVPVMVTFVVPVVAVELAVNVTELVEIVGLVPKLAVTPDGSPEADRVTLPVKPPESVTVMLLLELELWFTDTLVGEAEIVKSGFGAVFTTSVTVVECVSPGLLPVIVTV
jgi:hypothetical protein